MFKGFWGHLLYILLALFMIFGSIYMLFSKHA
jgi:hypothetical protein